MGYDNSLPDGKTFDRRADLGDGADKLVPQNRSCRNRRVVEFKKIGAAESAAPELQHEFTGTGRGHRVFFDSKITFAVVGGDAGLAVL